MKETLSIIFSKDRAMQLRATIDSFLRHCVDVENINIIIYYKASTEVFQKQYDKLDELYPSIMFISELVFETDIRTLLARYKFVLMQVDDNIWVRKCDIEKAKDLLIKDRKTIGFSYRLSPALKTHYITGRKISMPKHQEFDNLLKYSWEGKGHEFGYSLEVTGTLYRVEDIAKAMKGRRFTNPNSFEKVLSKGRKKFKNRPYLVCQKELSVFMAPVNLVQDCTKNKAGISQEYSVEGLSKKFDDGYKVDIDKFINFETTACGNEVQLGFIKDE